eukprot:CAMPEP_0180527278 /NCGR_PEP_ID=MMETSP1036_2-20121128/60152_1 /TAXON_ID=632150 /ORGANISM="Azadinium spinosum, Strain 3D9" /LENGTH=40 /DNA_ID= /DNA_START= /DNA_END= /DNA_ORIENTATION=
MAIKDQPNFSSKSKAMAVASESCCRRCRCSGTAVWTAAPA